MNVEILETILNADPGFMSRMNRVAEVPCFDPNYCGHVDSLVAVVFLSFPQADEMTWRDVESLVDAMAMRLATAGGESYGEMETVGEMGSLRST